MNKFYCAAVAAFAFVLVGAAGCAINTTGANKLTSKSPTTDLPSPNGKIVLRLERQQDGQLTYSVLNQGRVVVQASPLGILVDGVDLVPGSQITKTVSAQLHAEYPTRGTHSVAKDSGTLMLYHLISKQGVNWELDLRSDDDGVAIRYRVEGEGKRTVAEGTGVRLPAGSVVWAESVRGHYEDVPTRKELVTLKKGEFAAPPLTVELPDGGGYLSLTEAAVYQYAGAALQADGEGGFSFRLADKVPPSYPFTLRYGDAGVKRITSPTLIDGRIVTPWRVILVGDDLNTLVNSDLLTNLNPAPDKSLFPQGQATDWIKPGRAVWQYLDGHDNTVDGTKEFSQLAATLGFENNILEGYWSRWTDAELKDVVDYSRKRNVNIWVWLFSDPMRNIEKPRPPRPGAATQSAEKPRTAEQRAKLDLRNPVARRALFERLHNLGVAGLKIDFIDTEAKDAEDFYEDTLKDAAAYHLMVDFHGSAKPTGEQRTYPNELTREAIFGMEHRAFPAGQSAAKVHTVLPFTRFLAGSGDYTPVIFTSRRGNTTFVHQIATAVLFTSTLQTYAANPKNILLSPGAEMMESIPSVWDETRVLSFSRIGEIAGYARRSGNSWFIAIANGEQPREVTLDMSFLGEGRYLGEMLRDKDGGDGTEIEVEKGVTSGKDILKLKLGVGGGFVAKFSK